MTSPFDKYLGSELAPELLAIIPPGAPLSSKSTVDPKNLVKVPGRYNAESATWSGRRDWTEGFAIELMLREWAQYPNPNVGIRTKYFPAIDFDVDVQSLVEELLPIAEGHLGPAPVRGRDGKPRVTLLYRLADVHEPIRTYCLKFTLPQTRDAHHAIEILGDGRSTVMEGRHPTGGDYKWHGDVDPIDYGPDKLTPVTTERLRAFVGAVKEKLIADGATILSGNSDPG